ncbi:hypothetical protein MMC10_006766 [Thelotrema lepadinum]|nr:hypothetical protein [Thelotrema lepadinum]
MDNGLGVGSPIFLVLFLSVLLLAASLSLDACLYQSEGMPMARTSTRAISAACHPVEGRHGATETLQRLQYGVVRQYPNGKESVGFSSTEVKPPVRGGRYYDLQDCDGGTGSDRERIRDGDGEPEEKAGNLVGREFKEKIQYA